MPSRPRRGRPPAADCNVSTSPAIFSNRERASSRPRSSLMSPLRRLRELAQTGNNFGYCAFTAYGCFWIALALLLIGNHYNLYVSNKTDIGWFLIAWTGFTAILWVGSMRLNGALGLTFTLLLIGFILRWHISAIPISPWSPDTC